MITETNNLHLFLDADARLAAAAGGVARYLADAAGLESTAVTLLQSAVIAACLEAFRYLTAQHPHLEVIFVRLPDRLEISLAHEGNTEPPGRRRLVAAAPARKEERSSRPAAFSGVDQVQYETHGSEVVTRLTKYLGKVAPKI